MAIRDPPASGRCTMEAVTGKDNLRKALEHVKKTRTSKGFHPARAIRLAALFVRLAEVVTSEGKRGLACALRRETYTPSPVVGKDIPKKTGGTRRLGTPRLLDQVVQQAILQILSPLVDPVFSPYSFGYRTGMGPLKAIPAVREAVQAGYPFVLDLDIEQFFDRVNHGILLGLVAELVDRKVERLIQRFLTAGMELEREFVPREMGTPQGSPLSPLLANTYLNEFDSFLTHQGVPFARYADDIRIFCRTLDEAQRLLETSARFLTVNLKLNLSATKSKPCRVDQSTFLGYSFDRDGTPRVANEKLGMAKANALALARDLRIVNATERIKAINQYIAGWTAYYRLALPDVDALWQMDRDLFMVLRDTHPGVVRKRSGSSVGSGDYPRLLFDLGVKGFSFRTNPSAHGGVAGNGACMAQQRAGARPSVSQSAS